MGNMINEDLKDRLRIEENYTIFSLFAWGAISSGGLTEPANCTELLETISHHAHTKKRKKGKKNWG